MNEDVFNASLRKFLKKVGITSQREIEKVVRDAVASGRLKGHEKLSATMVLTSAGSTSRTRLPVTSNSARGRMSSCRGTDRA
jgi:hypothetical protein